MGAALAIAFHDAGHHVFATARNPDKLEILAARGITTIALDITSPTSISSATASLSTHLSPPLGLDILINNAATSYNMPLTDISLPQARDLFDTNVWSHIAVTQALLPFLLRSTYPAIIANHTSVGSVMAIPFQGVYNASKAALAMLTATLRMELSPFDVRVVDLKTGGVRTNIVVNNSFHSSGTRLPDESIYGEAQARELVERAMAQEELMKGRGVSAEHWAGEVMAELTRKGGPPREIWRGESAWAGKWVVGWLPVGWVEGMVRRMTGLDRVEGVIRGTRR
jgi:1-acylglycerone phosphate reductase